MSTAHRRIRLYVTAMAEASDVSAFLKFMAGVALILNGNDPIDLTPFKAGTINTLKYFKVPPVDFNALMKALTKGNADVIGEAARNFRKSFFPAFKTKINGSDVGVTLNQQALLGNLLSFFNSRSENSFNQVRLKIGAIKDAGFSARFVNDDPDHYANDLNALVTTLKRITKGKTVLLSPQQAKQLRDTDEAKFQTYNEAYKDLKNLYRERIRNLVRMSGQPLLTVKALRAGILKANPALADFLPPQALDGFKLDEGNKLFNPEGIGIVTGSGAPVEPMPGTDFKLNSGFAKSTDTNPKYLQYMNNVGNWQSLYLLKNRSAAIQKKTEKVQDLQENIDSLRAKWLRDMKRGNTDAGRLATIIELIYQTAARVGSTGGQTLDRETGKYLQTYGISSLLKAHVSMNRGKLKISYPGKKGIIQTHILDPDASPDMEKLVSNILQYLTSKTSKQPVFTTAKGEPIDSSEVNAYFKSVGGNTTVHKFRHAQGNTLFSEEAAKVSKTRCNTPANCFDIFKIIMTKVGDKLGHKSGDKVTWATASQNYVSGGTQKKYFTDRGYIPPRQIDKLDDA